jgi:hypothetical protein
MKQVCHIMVLASVVLGTGCAISTNLPANRLETPETYGESLALGADLGVQGGNSLQFSDDYHATPITDTPVYVRSNLGLKLGATIGVLRRLDFGLKLGLNTNSMLQAKLQLLGEHQRDAGEGNFSLAITGAVGYAGAEESGTDLFDSQVDSYSLDSYMFDGAVIAGYRVLDGVLIYGGPFVQRYEIDIAHELDGMSYGYAGTTYQSGANLGFGYSIEQNRQMRIDLFIEVVYAVSETGSSRAGTGFLGARVAAVRF